MYSFVYSILSLKAKRKSTSRSKSFLLLFYFAQNSVVIPGLSTQESDQKKTSSFWLCHKIHAGKRLRFERLHILNVFHNWMLIGYHATSCRDMYLLIKSIFFSIRIQPSVFLLVTCQKCDNEVLPSVLEHSKHCQHLENFISRINISLNRKEFMVFKNNSSPFLLIGYSLFIKCCQLSLI